MYEVFRSKIRYQPFTKNPTILFFFWLILSILNKCVAFLGIKPFIFDRNCKQSLLGAKSSLLL